MNPPCLLRLFAVVRIAVVSLGVGVLLSLTLLAPANAHDAVEKIEPADGSTVASVPAAAKLTLNNTLIALGAEVLVKDENGITQSNGPVVITDNHVAEAVKAGAPRGRYTVEWRIVSSDSHPIKGSFTFTAGKSNGPSAPGTASAPAAPGPESAPAAAAPWLFIGGAALLASGPLAVGRYVRRSLRDGLPDENRQNGNQNAS